MRIVGGNFRGTKLQGPGKKGNFRPTEDQTREALFNILAPYDGAFLDLYAGSGAVGLEAYSRGFGPITLVERDKQSLVVLQKNISRLLERSDTEADEVRLAKTSVQTFLKKCKDTFDVIFCDPPYGLINDDFLGKLLLDAPLAKDGILVLEHHARWLPKSILSPWQLLKSKKYGQCALSFFQQGVTDE